MARILLVDDDEAVRYTLARWLTADGHSVTEADEGQAAIDSHRAEPADLIVTDLVMPGIGGAELITRLKSTSPGVPIIAMSGKGRDYLEEARRLGAVVVLRIPCERDLFMAAVKSALSP